MRIIGIDPGLLHTGWGVIEAKNNALRFIAAGTIHPQKNLALAARLHVLNTQLAVIVAEHNPTAAAVEETFANVNGASTLKLGQARGALLLTLAQAGLEPAEYAANTIKKTLTGRGHGAKAQVEHMVKMLLPTAKGSLTADSWDALAVAICHAQHAGSNLR
ncbi:MAG: crossover junction endodeoxyribonuclease RuvC [Leptolyngbyaceae bacterium]|nr:crossover junction endodeoxyribonuclease RuvC [Leptolyngbyaceae bacterium]